MLDLCKTKDDRIYCLVREHWSCATFSIAIWDTCSAINRLHSDTHTEVQTCPEFMTFWLNYPHRVYTPDKEAVYKSNPTGWNPTALHVRRSSSCAFLFDFVACWEINTEQVRGWTKANPNSRVSTSCGTHESRFNTVDAQTCVAADLKHCIAKKVITFSKSSLKREQKQRQRQG